MGKVAGEKPGRLVELLVAHLEQVLARDVEVRSPELIPGRTSGELREVDVTLRRRVGTSDVLIAIECRDRKAPADVRWIDELASKRDEVGASVIVAVSTSGFTKGARRSAEAKGVQLRQMTQLGPEEIEQWFITSKMSLPRARFVEALVVTCDPLWRGQLIGPQDLSMAPRFMIPPNPEPLTLEHLSQRMVEQLLSSPEAVAGIPADGSGKPAILTITPERAGAEVITAERTYPLDRILIEFELRMEPLTPSGMEARKYEDSDGVFAEKSSYVYPFPGGWWTVEVTVTPPEGEPYLFKHGGEVEPGPPRTRKRRK